MIITYNQMQQRSGTTAQWAAADPVLLTAEIGVDTDIKRMKIGDGITPWSQLKFEGGEEIETPDDILVYIANLDGGITNE